MYLYVCENTDYILLLLQLLLTPVLPPAQPPSPLQPSLQPPHPSLHRVMDPELGCTEQLHDRMHFYIEVAWICSTGIGILLFLVQVLY